MKKFCFLVLFLSITFTTAVVLAQFKDGDLIKGSQDKVYLMIDGKACWIPNKDVFTSMGLDWNSIKLIDDAKLKKLSKGDLIFKNKVGQYYHHTNGKVALIGDEKLFKSIEMNNKFVRDLSDIFKKNKYDWNTVYVVDAKILNAIPEGTPVK